jgi:hypothetical protein
MKSSLTQLKGEKSSLICKLCHKICCCHCTSHNLLWRVINAVVVGKIKFNLGACYAHLNAENSHAIKRAFSVCDTL